MQVSVENVGGLARRLNITLPAEDLEKAFSQRLNQLSRQVKVAGFRPGKVPLRMVEAQYGAQVLEEAAGEIIRASFSKAVGQNGLRPAGGPRIQPKSIVRGKEFAYTAEFEVFPEVPEPTLKGTKIERPVVAVTDEDIGRTLETIRRQRTRFDVVAREAQSGDRVVIDFTGKLDGVPFDGGAAKRFPVVLGGKTLLDDLEKGLLGSRAGDTPKIAVQFPSDYRNTKLAGRAAEFDVTVNEVMAPVVPEVDEALARELGVASGSVDDLRRQISDNLKREAAKRSEGIVRTRVMQALLNARGFDVPTALVNEEMANSKSRGGESAAVPDDQLRAHSHVRVALGLILGEAMKRFNIQPDSAAVRARLEQMAAEYESPDEFIRWHYEQPGRLESIELLVAEERVVAELLKGADVTDQPVGFEELLQINEALR